MKNADLVAGDGDESTVLPGTRVSQTCPDNTGPCRLQILSPWRAGSVVSLCPSTHHKSGRPGKMFAEGEKQTNHEATDQLETTEERQG